MTQIICAKHACGQRKFYAIASPYDLTWLWLCTLSSCDICVCDWVCYGRVKSVKSNSEPCVSAPRRSVSSVSKNVKVWELGPYASTLMFDTLQFLKQDLHLFFSALMSTKVFTKSEKNRDFSQRKAAFTPSCSERHTIPIPCGVRHQVRGNPWLQ